MALLAWLLPMAAQKVSRQTGIACQLLEKFTPSFDRALQWSNRKVL
jgi:hypothetical protein